VAELDTALPAGWVVRRCAGDSKTDVRSSQLFFRAVLGGEPDPYRDWQASEEEGLRHPFLCRPADTCQKVFAGLGYSNSSA
jgi:hypothetical protein